MFSACETYEKQLRIEKTRLSHQVWSHGGSTFKKKRTLNGHFSRPAETYPYVAFLVIGHDYHNLLWHRLTSRLYLMILHMLLSGSYLDLTNEYPLSWVPPTPRSSRSSCPSSSASTWTRLSPLTPTTEGWTWSTDNTHAVLHTSKCFCHIEKKLKSIHKQKVEIDLFGYHANANRSQQLRTI